MEKMERIRNFFSENDQLAKQLGVELLEVSPGRAKTRMAIKEEHLNGVRLAHGGAIFTLADVAFAAACNSHGTVALALNVSISFLEPAGAGDILFAEATEASVGRKVGHYDIPVTRENCDLIALFHGLAYRKKDPLPLSNSPSCE